MGIRDYGDGSIVVTGKPRLFGVTITKDIATVSGGKVTSIEQFHDILRISGVSNPKWSFKEGEESHELSISEKEASFDGKKITNLEELQGMLRTSNFALINNDLLPVKYSK
jgi:hypothetical protein